MQNYSPKFKVLLHVLFVCLIFNFSLLTFNFDKAEASALSLSIDPSIIVVNAVPPTTATSELRIQNKSDTQVTLQIQLKSFKAKGENGELEYLREASQIFKNIQIMDAGVPIENITLDPKQQKNLTLSISIPQDPARNATPRDAVGTNISPADHYFSIIFVSQNTSIPTSNSSLNQIGIATHILLSVGPKVTPKAAIEEFSSNIFFEKGPVPFTIRVKNTGTHFIRPMGEITIKNMFGQSIGKLDLTSINVLSDSIRAIPNKNSSDFKHPVALWQESFLLGLYTATLNLSLSDEGPIFTRTIHFFAFPFQALIIIVVIAIAAIAVRNRLKAYMDKDRT